VLSPVLGYLGEIVERSQEWRWVSGLDAHVSANRRRTRAFRPPCRKAARSLAGAGPLPEPEAEEGARTPGSGQLGAVLPAAGELAGREVWM
jgi:hypothetical protein